MPEVDLSAIEVLAALGGAKEELAAHRGVQSYLLSGCRSAEISWGMFTFTLPRLPSRFVEVEERRTTALLRGTRHAVHYSCADPHWGIMFRLCIPGRGGAILFAASARRALLAPMKQTGTGRRISSFSTAPGVGGGVTPAGLAASVKAEASLF